MPTAQALETARKRGYDLVEVAPTSVPPVCRLLDYGKFKYEQAKKDREARRGQKIAVLREIRLRPKIGEHDFDAKTRSVKKLIDEGDKVKVTIMFRGREITHADLGFKLLQKMMETLKGQVVIDKQPIIEGQRMHLIISPAPQTKSKEKAKTQAESQPGEKKEKETADAKT